MASTQTDRLGKFSLNAVSNLLRAEHDTGSDPQQSQDNSRYITTTSRTSLQSTHEDLSATDWILATVKARFLAQQRKRQRIFLAAGPFQTKAKSIPICTSSQATLTWRDTTSKTTFRTVPESITSQPQPTLIHKSSNTAASSRAKHSFNKTTSTPLLPTTLNYTTISLIRVRLPQ